MMGERTVLPEGLFYSFNLDRYTCVGTIASPVTAMGDEAIATRDDCRTGQCSRGGVHGRP